MKFLAKIRLKLTTCIPSPYQVDLFNAISRIEDVDLQVLYWRQTTSHFFRLDLSSANHRWRIMKGIRIPGANDVFCPGIVGSILRLNYDVYVISGLGPTSFLAMFLLTLLRRKWLFWGEKPHPYNTKSFRGKIKSLMWRMVGFFSSGIISIGTWAREAYQDIGVPADKIRNGPYAPDVQALLNPDPDFLKQAEAIRERIGADNQTIVYLYCGSLTDRKGVDVLLRSFNTLRKKCSKAQLLIVGDGPCRSQLETLANELPHNAVVFAGVQQRPNLFWYYLAADVFVFPTRYDGWGVVLNEAFASGLPTISTTQCGAAIDMIEPGKNGFIVCPDDVESFCQAMLSTLNKQWREDSTKDAVRQTGKEFGAEAQSKKIVVNIMELTSMRSKFLPYKATEQTAK